MMPVPRRGDIYYVSLDPTFGSEAGGFKLRPVVVISVNDLNDRLRVFTAIPGSSVKDSSKPMHKNNVRVEPTPENKLAMPTDFQCQHIRAIAHGRITQPKAGQLSWKDIKRIEDCLRSCLGLT